MANEKQSKSKIVRTTIEGRPASALYLDAERNPVGQNDSKAVAVRINFDDGDTMLAMLE